MLIQPLLVTDVGAWTDKAGNSHFVLQTRKTKNPLLSLFSSFEDFPFRILYKCTGRPACFLVAHASIFEEILTTWKFIELQIVRPIGELTGTRTTDQIDSYILLTLSDLAKQEVGKSTWFILRFSCHDSSS